MFLLILVFFNVLNIWSTFFMCSKYQASGVDGAVTTSQQIISKSSWTIWSPFLASFEPTPLEETPILILCQSATLSPLHDIIPN
jgi:hypothetical protein